MSVSTSNFYITISVDQIIKAALPGPVVHNGLHFAWVVAHDAEVNEKGHLPISFNVRKEPLDLGNFLDSYVGCWLGLAWVEGVDSAGAPVIYWQVGEQTGKANYPNFPMVNPDGTAINRDGFRLEVEKARE